MRVDDSTTAPTAELWPATRDAQGRLALAPTDVSQFIRLDQCQRYLRLRLHDRSNGQRFVYEYGVKPQSIPPLLTRSGRRFEEQTEQAVPPGIACNLALERAVPAQPGSDNERVVLMARELAAGEVRIIFQPRLTATIAGWHIRGDVDILRLERDAGGTLRALIADMKSSTSTRVEHRLQVAFYHEMLGAIFQEAGVECAEIAMGILYRGPSDDDAATSDEEREQRELQREQASRLFWSTSGLFERIDDPDRYLGSVRELVTGPHSTATSVAELPFERVPWHLTYKCDGCLYNEVCLKWADEHDDLSLLPHLTAGDKSALQALGIATMRNLAALREPVAPGSAELRPAPGREADNRRVATTWPIGPRIDELVFRARKYRSTRGDPVSAPDFIPSRGHGSLPHCDAEHNPNLVRIYLDAQHDYLHDRIYLLGALVVASEDGRQPEHRRRAIVRLADGPPTSPEHEERLFLEWITEVLRAVRELAAPDADGLPLAPVHLIFFDRFDQRVLLEGLSRHFTSIVGATPIFDLITQIAAFDSPVVSFLDQEIREHRNFPMVCQSLQAVAAWLRFDWRSPEDFRSIFRARMFDYIGISGRDDEGRVTEWYTKRSRFNSQIPLEYAYAAWGDLDDPADPDPDDDYARYRGATPDLLKRFQKRRLEALEHVAMSFRGNERTAKSSFDLSAIDSWVSQARTLADALAEFLTIERHVYLAAWKAALLPPPERRVLTGGTLLVRYLEEDQDPGVAELNRRHARKQALREAYEAEYQATNPDATKAVLSKDQKKETDWSPVGMTVRLRVEITGVDCDLDDVLALNQLRESDWVLLYPRWATDGRLPEAERVPFQPTPKQMLYGMRGEIERVDTERDENGSVAALVKLSISQSMGGAWSHGYLFGTFFRPFVQGECYTLDANPNDINGYRQLKVVQGLQEGRSNTLYDRLLKPSLKDVRIPWPIEAIRAQQRFMDGLVVLHAADPQLMHDFEPPNRTYIGERGDDAVLLVQGPPGTGKSYTTAFALFARLQGAMSAGRDDRVLVSCKTHAATDVLLGDIAMVREMLRTWRVAQPAVFARYFDERLLDVPLFRIDPRGSVRDGIIPLHKKSTNAAGQPKVADALSAQRWAVAGSTPGGIYTMIQDRWGASNLFGHELMDALVLDEASQMSLPEALLAALPLKSTGQLIVVGDHRQMPPIVQHDWEHEPRRTFQEYRTYRSLFDTLRDPERELEMVRFEVSYRLHADMAEFLRREVYQYDGIPFRAMHTDRLRPIQADDPLVATALDPGAPLVVIVHDESRSQMRNPFEQALITPILEALARDAGSVEEVVRLRLGVVVPHRAQRAAVQRGVPAVTVRDSTTGLVRMSAVDTVERFQGDERESILVSATESDPQYLLASSGFLLDPRRLTVALSRARRKMILVAARSVFNLFSSDEETFANAQIWKNLLRHTCTVPLWSGVRDGVRVEVWGNQSPEGAGRSDGQASGTAV